MNGNIIENRCASSLGEKIRIEYNKLAVTVWAISDRDRALKIIEGAGGKVSVSDLTAYQIGWGELLISWYEMGLSGTSFIMPGAGFSSWDYTGLARYFYDAYHYDGAVEQLEKFCMVVERIIEIVCREDEAGRLDAVGVWAWCTLKLGKQWPLSKWVMVNTVSPYKRALAAIRKNFKNNIN